MKDCILKRLKGTGSQYVSGEMLSEDLGVSRTTVWKCIKELRKEGYVIESSSKKGYKLISAHDVINSCEISYNLGTELLGRKIHCFDVIDSTNHYAKKIAFEGCDDGTVVIAEQQTAGRGRLGRQWHSAGKKGIWLSVVLRPEIVPSDVQMITLAAAISVVSAVKEATGIVSAIKWPNDIILDNKKVCGILTEMNSEMEQVNFVILGIGINTNQDTEDFPEDIRDIAVSLKTFLNKSRTEPAIHKSIDRSKLIRALLVELDRVYRMVRNGDIHNMIDEWKKYSVTLGKEVSITVKNETYRGIANDITMDGKLLVKCSDGMIREVVSGEVSVRGLMGYV